MVPKPIDHDAGEEILPRTDRLVGQLEPPARGVRGLGLRPIGGAGKQRQAAPWHEGHRTGVLATDEERLVIPCRFENARRPPRDRYASLHSPVALDRLAQRGELGEGRGEDPAADEKVEQRSTVVIE